MQLNEEELKNIVSIVGVLHELSCKARREGLLALDDDISAVTEKIDGKAGEFAKILLKFIVDGIDTETVDEIAKNLIASTELSDFEKVLFPIVVTGCHSIQVGDNPRILVKKCASQTGISGFYEIVKKLDVDD